MVAPATAVLDRGPRPTDAAGHDRRAGRPAPRRHEARAPGSRAPRPALLARTLARRVRPRARGSRRHRQIADEPRARAAPRGDGGGAAMNDLEQRLEELFMADSRARRVDRVTIGARGGSRLAPFAFVGAVALAT